MKTILAGALEEEMTLRLAASRCRRTERRRGQGNGFYQRDLATQISG